MRPGDYLATVGRIRQGLIEIGAVAARVERIWKAEHHADDWYIDAVALNLHGFYAGVERLLEVIAESVDRAKPAGADWHVALLSQMAAEIPGVRAAVISADLKAGLDRYRSFRHVVRNVYTFNFDPEQVARLVELLPGTRAAVDEELLKFAWLLEKLAGE